MELLSENDSTKQKNYLFLIVPSILLFTMWSIKLYEYSESLSLSHFSLYPRNFKQLYGIFTMPFIHSDYKHLLNNSIPLFILTGGLYYFYKDLATKIIFWIYLISGFWVWCAARPSYHIGASALVYGLASFIFFSGVIRKEIKLLAFSLIVVFLYGSMVWGIFPTKEHISWEGHLFGFIIGLILAIVFQKEGPQKKVYDWEEDENENDDVSSFSNEEHIPKITIHYEYKEGTKSDKDI